MPAVTPLLVGEGWMAFRRAARESARRLTGQEHVVDWYDSPQDPHAALLAQAMPRFRALYDVEVRRFEVPMPEAPLVADPEREAAWRAMDAAMIAPHHGLEPPVTGPAEATPAELADNAKRQRSAGHFAPGVLHYGGEWYRGVDRLGLLESRLASAGAGAGHAAPREDSCAGPFDSARAVDAFVSIRSPYSAIAMARLAAVEAAGMTIRYRPVLPMVMRGLPVPRLKRMRILFDAAREAHARGVPFGRICDPLGAGTERVMAVFPLAEAAGRGGELLRIASRAAWAEGVNLATDGGLRRVCERAQIPWSEAQSALRDDRWRAMVAANRDELLGLGLWGVPCFVEPQTGFKTWGQDRLWLVARELRLT